MNSIKTIIEYDIFKHGQNSELFIGRLFDSNKILVAESWKHKVKETPEGCFLLAFSFGDDDKAFLLRVLKPTTLPTDDIIVSSLIDCYKADLKTSGKSSDLDDFTRYDEFSLSGLECIFLGTFYKNKGQIEFQAKCTNHYECKRYNNNNNNKCKWHDKYNLSIDSTMETYAANNFKVYKATDKVLDLIFNRRDSELFFGGKNKFSIGKLRYSSSISSVKIYINPNDMLGKITALFGMTGTGKSNTVKKIIEVTSEISNSAVNKSLPNETSSTFEPIDKISGKPLYKVGQLIFDTNGEYANANLQDEGTAIFDMYKNNTIRYTMIEKADDFRVMKVNFYSDLVTGFDLIKRNLKVLEDNIDWVSSLLSIDFDEPKNYRVSIQHKTSDEKIAAIEYDKKVALYKCCLSKAGFPVPHNLRNVKFFGDEKTINTICPSIKPHEGITLEQATTWFETIYDAGMTQFNAYKTKSKGREYFDKDMLALLKFLIRKNKYGDTPIVKIRSLSSLHTTDNIPFEIDIINALRGGKIVIVDLSQGQPSIQKSYAEKICKGIFHDSMNRFINSKANNFIQFYFGEIDFYREDEIDSRTRTKRKYLSRVYDRIAEKGAKLNLGIIYVTQDRRMEIENTKNWFVHLNHDDETENDRGFVKIETYSNPLAVPVQIDRFSAK